MKNIIKQIKKFFKKNKSMEAQMLLELLEKYPDSFTTGFCNFICKLYFVKNIITCEEYKLLDQWILCNSPKRKHNDYYWFKLGDIKSRIKYLKTFV